MTTLPRLLTVVGDPHDINTWSNIPYFFLQAGQQAGFLTDGLPLDCDRLKQQRLLWNAGHWLTTGEYGGFQYSPTALRSLFSQVTLPPGPVEFISHFPLLPPRPWAADWRVSYYLDATLRQNFEDYGIGQRVSQRMQQQALQQETENYRQARYIICMGRSGARSVVEDYGIDPAKVHVIPGGANLHEAHLPSATELVEQPTALSPVRLGFIGKDWQRKGLPFLLAVADDLQARGIAVEVRVIGPRSADLPDHPCLRPLGFIDKATQLPLFVDQVRSFHFGCLFSSAEAFGISNLECIRLGVPVLARRIGGIPETVPAGLGHLFDPSDAAAAVADVVERYVDQPQTYHAWRSKVVARVAEVTWATTVQRFMQVWDGSREFQYGP